MAAGIVAGTELGGAPSSARRLRGNGRRGVVLSHVRAVVIVVLKTLLWTVSAECGRELLFAGH